MCSYEMEKDVSKQLVGQSRAIASKGSAVILVEVASERQSKRMRVQRLCYAKSAWLVNTRCIMERKN